MPGNFNSHSLSNLLLFALISKCVEHWQLSNLRFGKGALCQKFGEGVVPVLEARMNALSQGMHVLCKKPSSLPEHVIIGSAKMSESY